MAYVYVCVCVCVCVVEGFYNDSLQTGFWPVLF